MSSLRWALLAFVAALSVPAFATDAVAVVVARIEQPDLLRGQFEQRKQIAGFRKPLRSHGRFVLVRGLGVIWRTEQPFPSQLTMTERRLRVTSDAGARAMDAANEPALRAINRIFFDLLTGHIEGLRDGFDMQVVRADEHGWNLRLTPKDGLVAQAFTSIDLEGGRRITRIVLTEVNGDVSDIRFGALAISPSLDDQERAELAD